MTEQDKPEPGIRAPGIYQQADGSAIFYASPHLMPAGRTDPDRPRCTCARLPDADGVEHPVNWLMNHAEVEVVTTSGMVYVGSLSRSSGESLREYGDVSVEEEGAWHLVVGHDDESKDVDLSFAEITSVTPVRPTVLQDALQRVAEAAGDLERLLARGGISSNLPIGSEEDHEHLVFSMKRPQHKLDCTPWPRSMAAVGQKP